jgi:hypothetical protein
MSSALSASQKQALLDSLNGLDNVASALASFDKLGAQLPVIDTSIGKALNVASVLQNQLINPLNAATTTTTDNVVNVLKGLNYSSGGLTVGVDPTKVTGGLMNCDMGDELQFNLVFNATETSTVGIDLGTGGQSMGLSANASVTLTANFSLDFTFGYDLTPGLAKGDAAFVRVNSLTVGASVSTTSLNANAKIGFLEAQVQNGTLNLNAGLSATFNDPDQDAKHNLTLSELATGASNLGTFVTLAPTNNTLNATLPVHVSLGSYTPSGTPTITVTSTDLFSGAAPSVAVNSDFSELLNFDHLTPGDFTSLFNQLGSGLQAISASLNPNTAHGGIPFISTQVNQVVDLNAMLSTFTHALYNEVLAAPSAAPANGQLSADAHFAIQIDSNAPVSVTLTQAATAGNHTIDDLVGSLNAALPSTLASSIHAGRSGNQLEFTATNSSISQFEIQISDPNDPAATQLGFAVGEFSSPVFKFDSIQSLVPLLANVMGISQSQVNPQYDPATHSLTFGLSFQDANFSKSVPMSFSSGLGPLTFEASANANFTASATLAVTLGIQLSGLDTVLTGTADAPTNGQLSGDAHFALTVGTNAPVNVTVAKDATNTTIDNLVTDINTALATAGLGGTVTAGHNGNRITLTENNAELLQVSASAGDPALTDLHLPTAASGPDWSHAAFVTSSSQLTASASISATNVTGRAALGILGVGVQNGNASFSIGTGVTLNTSDPSGRIPLADLIANLSSDLNVQSPTVTVNGHFPLTVSGINVGISGTPPAFDLSLGTPNDLSTLSFAPNSQFNSLLSGFQSFDTANVIQLIQQLANMLKGSNVGAFSAKLPLINKSINDLLGLADSLVNKVSSLQSQVDSPALKATAQNILDSLMMAIGNLPASLPEANMDQLTNVFDALKNAVMNDGRTDLTNPINLPEVLVATVGALNDAVAALPSGTDLSAFNTVITSLQNATPSLQSLSNVISSALGISSPNSLSLQIVNATPSSGYEPALVVHLHFQPSYSASVNLDSLAIPNLGPLTFTAAGTVMATIGGNLEFDFGYDIKTATPFLQDSSSFSLTAQVVAANLAISASIGGASIQLGTATDPASITLKNHAGTGPANVSITVNHTNQNIGQIPFSALTLSTFNFGGLDGQLNANLPLYLNTTSLGPLTVMMDLANPANVTVTPPPNLASNLLSAAFNFQNLFTGIDTILTFLQTGLQSNIIGQLPVIGHDLNLAGSFIGKLRTNFLTPLENASSYVQTALQQVIFNNLGSPGLGILYYHDSMGNLVPVPDYQHVDVTIDQTNGLVKINIEIHGSDTLHTSFNLGLSGLGMSVATTGGVTLNLGYDVSLGFGLSKQQGFFFAVNNAGSPELNLNLGVSLDPGTQLSAQLFFLYILAQTNTDHSGNSLTGFSGNLAVKLHDPNGDGMLTPAEIQQAGFSNLFDMTQTGISTTVNINLHVKADVSADDALPSVAADLVIHWGFSTGQGFSGTPDVSLNNVTLMLGTFFTKVAAPIFNGLNQFLEPIRPILDILNTDIPVISDLSQLLGQGPVTFASAISAIGEGGATVATVLRILNDVNTVVTEVSGLGSSNIGIDFGSYHFSAAASMGLESGDASQLDFSDPNNGTLNNLIGTGSAAGQIAQGVLDQINNSGDPNASMDSSLLTQMNAGADTSNGLGLKFPIFENPLSAIGLLFGKTVTLVTWDIPKLQAGFSFQYLFGPILPPIPLFARIAGDFNVAFHVGIGFDTRGLQTGNFLDGFFFEVLPDPVIDFSAEFTAGAKLNLVVAAAGVDGGIKAEIAAQWHDPDKDGKVYFDELAANAAMGLNCIFDISGKLTAFLEAYVKIGFDTPFGFVTLWSADFTLASITLLDYTYSCPPLAPPEPAHISTGTGEDAGIPAGVLILNVGPFAGDRQPGHNTDGDETESVKQISPGVMEVTGFGQTKDYGSAANPITGIYGDGGAGKNNLTIDSSVTVNATLKGGNGDDQLTGGGGHNTIIGGGGNDVLRGGPLDDNISAGVGNASIYGNDGNDLISVQGGNNYIDAGAGNDTVYGGTGNDKIYGGDGDDCLFGGNGGNDQIYGGKGNDHIDGQGGAGDLIYGGPGNNTIYGSAGDDIIYADIPNAPAHEAGQNTIYGQDGNDLIYGGDNYNEIHGGNGNDYIQGGPVGDLLYGDAGNDSIIAGNGNDSIHGGTGDDYIQGNGGNDLIYTDDGNDLVHGGDGADSIYGGNGNQSLYGDTGNDQIYGGSGTEYLDGGDGNDFIFVGSGPATVHGGTGDDYIKSGVGNELIYGDAGNDLLVQTVDANQTLTNNSLTGQGTDFLNGIERVLLTGGTSANTFDVGGWTSVVSLVGGGGADVVAATDNADFTLADGNVTISTGASIYLTGITRANLTGGAGDNTFDVSRWTGTATLTGGGGNDKVVAVNNANFTLTDTSLTRSSGGSFTLAAITGAVLSGGPGNNKLDASGFSGNASLYGAAGNDTLLGGAGEDYLDGGTGVDSLVGGTGNDILVARSSTNATINGSSGDDVIYGSDGADLINGNAGNDRIYGYGGSDTISGGPGDDTIDGGTGDDVISGDTGSDLIIGGAGNDLIYGYNASGTGDDGAVDYLYGDFGTNGNEAGSGNDTIHGGTGNDLMFGEGGTNVIDGGGPGAQIDNSTGGSVSPIPAPIVPTPANWPPAALASTATLPTGIDYTGRWTEFESSATNGGLSNSPGQALEPSIVAGNSAQYVAWADNRSASFGIDVAEHTGGAWQELAGSAHGNGISAIAGTARRPSITLDSTGAPVVAWTIVNGASNDIYVARYSSTANGGQGGWVALGTSLNSGGISITGKADNASIVLTSAGLVVAWLDTSSGAANIYVKEFNGTSWVALGSGATSGQGVSGSATSVSGLSLATDGTKVAVAWSQSVSGTRQIYLKEYNGTAWNALGGSASGGGLRKTAGQSLTPSLAYFSGALYAAWQDNTNGPFEIYAATYNGSAWVPAGTGAASGGGISHTGGGATQPKLATNGGRLYLLWLDNRVLNFTGNTTGLYVKRWNGSAFAEELVGDASYRGIGDSVGAPSAPAFSVDPSGHPFVAWDDTASGGPQIYVRGNTFDINQIHYVNDGSQLGDAFTTAVGAAANDGLSPAKPKPSLQAVLGDAAHPLHSGDVILIDGGFYSGGINIAANISGVYLFGSPNSPATFGGLLTINGANVTVENIALQGGVTVASANGVRLTNDTFYGPGLTLNGGSGEQIDHDLVSASGVGLTLTGGVSGATIEHNVILGGTQGINVAGSGATGFEIRDNHLAGSGTGVELGVAASGHIDNNDVSAVTTALDVSNTFTGLIGFNNFHDSFYGVDYAASAQLSANRIYNNTFGVVSTVAATANAFGFVGTTQPNQIGNNSVGVQLTGVMQNQHIFANGTGVIGSGSLVSSDLNHANLIETNSVGVNFSGPIEFQRIARNTIGIQAQSSQLIAHDLIYRNTQTGVSIQGQTDVRIINDTFYTPSGDLIRAENNSSVVEIRDDILWTDNGYDIYVANDSQTGFFSDYNDLHAGPAGKLVFWTRDFTDILDWQQDVALYDLHSIGYTVVHPRWSDPRFLAKALDDYRIFDETARQRFSSPTIDAGDPLTDQALPSTYHNLLTNPSFESGLTAWTASPSGGTQSSNPAPWDGSKYFFAGSNAVTSVSQTVNLTTSGFTAGQIDSLNLFLVFGGRVRSASETPPDSGTITLTFYDASNNQLKQVTAIASNTTDRWELIGSRLPIPTGSRTVKFTFTATRVSGGTDDSYLDGAFLYVLTDTTAPNQGAYGNTTAETTQNLAQHLVLRTPNLYVDWLRDTPQNILWDSYGNVANAQVRIDLYQDTPTGPQFLLNIAPSAPDTGQYSWIAASSGVNYGTYGLRIQISIVGSPSVFDRSTEAFTVPENNNTFYVNDSSTTGDQYTTAIGNVRNDGKLPSAPKPYPNNILRIYSLGPTQTLYVDTGDYPLLAPIVLSGIVGIGDDRGFTFTGPTVQGASVTFEHANSLTVAPLIELNDAPFTTLEYLTLQNAQYGIYAHNSSTNLTAEHLTVLHSSLDGVRVDTSSSVLDMGHITSFASGRYGIYIDGSVSRLHDSTVTFSGSTGISLNNPGTGSIDSNESGHNGGYGILVNDYISGTNPVIGKGDLTQGQGNYVHDNAYDGIYAFGPILVSGNAVSGSVGIYDAGIRLGSGAQATFNVVHDNYRGIATSGGNTVLGNRVYHNADAGLLVDYNSTVADNVIYSNLIGIWAYYYSFSGTISNNLIYANTNQGILLQGVGYYSGTPTLVNNTVYQPQGDAIRAEQSSQNVQLRNNILWAQSGYDSSVAADSQHGFASDYNLLYATGTGQVGLWQGVARPDLTSWQSADFTDQHSLSLNPLFVNPTGADGFLGYNSPVNDGRDDDFHEQSLHGSFHGGALAPVLSATTGLPVFLTPSLTTDAAESPAIDRGAPTDSFANEPAPNGNFINIGAYGNTAQASLSPTHYVLLIRPDGGEVWPEKQTFTITWRSQDNNATVNIDLMQDGNSTPILNIASGVANNGQYSWTIPTSITPASNYRIRVTRTDAGMIAGLSDADFSIAAPVSVYYVNDGSVNPSGDWTTAPGSDANDGLTPATPKASISAILASYSLNPGDVIRVDDGVYSLSTNLVLNAAASGIKIVGYNNPTYPTRRALLNRGNTNSGSYGIELDSAVNVTLDHVQVTGAYEGIYAGSSSASTGLTLSNSTLFGNQYAGLFLDSSNDNATLTGDTFYGLPGGPTSTDDQSYGVLTYAAGMTIAQALAYDNSATDLYLYGARERVTGSEVYGASTGIAVTTYSSVPADQSQITGNTVHDLRSLGLSIVSNVRVSGNTVYDQTSPGATGIAAASATVDSNLVHDNDTGISASSSSVTNNRVYNSTTTGIAISSGGTVQGNQVYSNSVGISVGSYFSGLVANNRVYRNSAEAILVQDYSGTPQLVNNTVYQPQGDGIRVQSGSQNVHLRNNILWSQAGYDISVADDSQTGFQSDFNLFYDTGTGKLGLWQGVSFTDQPTWFYETGLDGHSLFANPLLNNPNGPDGVLGFGTSTVGSPVILDDSSSSGFALVGSWTANSSGYHTSSHSIAIGDGSSTATWTFTGLTAGATYRIAVTWPQSYSWAYDAPFTILSGGKEIAVVRVNEEATPSSFTASGVRWQTLGYFQATGTSLVVRLSNKASTNSVVADAVQILQFTGDHGADDDFHLQPASPGVDRGDPTDPYYAEPTPNGGRIDIGAYGNTAGATASPVQVVHLEYPNQLEKLQLGQLVNVSFQTDGLTLQRPVALIDAGGSVVASWDADTFSPGGYQSSFTNPVDTSGVTNPAPQAVYQSYAAAYGGAGNGLTYHLAVPDGVYTVRLHFAEPYQYAYAGYRKFDIDLQGTTVLPGYDIYADAGAAFKATVQTFSASATGGTGLTVFLASLSGYAGAVLSGLEVLADNPNGVAAPTVNLDLSADNGVTWTSLVTNVPLDRFGNGNYPWTIPANQPLGSQYLIRVTSNDGSHPTALSSQPFLITINGHAYYVNDNSTTGDVFTTAVGNNANSGKSPNQPMANLAALLSTYDLGPGDTVYVDAGSYNVLRNVVVLAQDSGVTIVGPSSAAALLSRGNTNSTRYAFELQGATNVTLDHLQITGGYYGISAANGAASTGLTVSHSTVFGNYNAGIFLDSSNDNATLAGDTVYGVPGGSSTDNQNYGIDLYSNNDVVSGNTVYDNGYAGISANGIQNQVTGNLVYGNYIGIGVDGEFNANNSIVSGNIVHDNASTGISASYAVLVTGNTVYNQSSTSAIGISGSSVTITGNIVYTNTTGISASSSTVQGNRLYNNSTVAIYGSGASPLIGNKVYSNSLGIQTDYYFNAPIEDNLIYANTNAGILLQSAATYTKVVANNTIYQPVGDAIQLKGGTQNVTLANNILWVEAGYDIYADSTSQTGLASDYNLLHKGTDPNAHIGFWNGAIQDTLSAWQTATSQDAHTGGGDPLFVDRDGADNVLGYAQVNGSFRDGGLDDNFYLAKNSPAIDHGASWVGPATDIEGLGRKDDPGTANNGSPDYFQAVQSSSLFTATGAAQHFNGDNTYYNLNLPFAFPFYGASHTTVEVSTEGFLELDTAYAGDSANTIASLSAHPRIAPLWDDLSTYHTGNDIFVDTSVANQVTIRWQGVNDADGSPVNFAVVLFGDGRIRFDYGSGNTNLTPTVGISAGDGQHYQIVSGYDGKASLTNAKSVLFTLKPGIVDIGAYEFRGSSLDTTPPTIAGTTPTIIQSSGATGAALTQLQVTFSERVNPIDAGAPAIYELRKAGSNGFGSPDDVVYTLTPSYDPNGTVATLAISGFTGGALPGGLYRLTIFSNNTASIHDLAGLLLDGDSNGTAGGNYVRVFTIDPHFGISATSPVTAGKPFTVTVTALQPDNTLYPTYTLTAHFTSSDLKAILPGNYTFTASDNGKHSFSVTFKTAGVQTFTATDTTDAVITGSGTVTVMAAAASSLNFAGYPASVVAGTAHQIIVTARDLYGNIATGYSGTVHFTSGDPQAVLPTDYIFMAPDAGVHTFTITLKTAGTQSVTATDTVATTLNAAKMTNITVTPAALTKFVVTGFGSPIAAGASSSFTVAATDAYGNVITSYLGTVHFTSSDAKAVLPANYTFTATDLGVHTFTATLKTAGVQSLMATDTVTSTLKGSQAGIMVNPAAVSKLVMAGYPASVGAGTTHSFTVKAEDAYGNINPGYVGTVHFTSSDHQAALPPNYTFASGDQGVHTFAAILKTLGTQSITATDTVTATITGSQTGITVTPGPATQFMLSASPGTIVAGNTITVTVTAQDGGGNTSTGYRGTVHFTSTDPQAGLPADYTFTAADAGIHTFTITLKTSGTQTVTAADKANASLTGSSSGIVVTAAALSQLIVAGFPSPVVAGTSANFTVTAGDLYGNPIVGYRGTIHFTSGDPRVMLPANYTFMAADQGVHTFSATLRTAGSQSITATDTINGTLKANEVVQVTPAAANHFNVALFPSPEQAGTSATFRVIARDAFNNTDSNYRGTVVITSSDINGAVLLPGPYTFTAGDAGVHMFSATLVTSGTQSLTVTDQVSASITGSQTGIAITPAPLSQLAVAGFPSPVVAGTSANFTVTAEDPYGNVITSYAGTVHFTSGDSRVTLPANYTFTAADQGVHIFTATLRTAGGQSIASTDTVNGSIKGSETIQVTPGAVTHFNVALFPSPIVAGTLGTFRVIARDAYNNTVSGYRGTVSFSSSDTGSGVVLPGPYTFTAADAGTHTFSAILVTPGTQSITATDTVTSSTTGSQTGILVNPSGVTQRGGSAPVAPSGAASPGAGRGLASRSNGMNLIVAAPSFLAWTTREATRFTVLDTVFGSWQEQRYQVLSRNAAYLSSELFRSPTQATAVRHRQVTDHLFEKQRLGDALAANEGL